MNHTTDNFSYTKGVEKFSNNGGRSLELFTTLIDSPVVDISTSSETSSIYIVAVDERIKREFIFKKLCLLNIGYIHKLTEIPCKYQPGYKRVFIRIRWNTLPHTINIRNRLMIRETIKFVYELPWVWTITS